MVDRPRAALSLAVALVALAATGCGSTSTPTAASTQAGTGQTAASAATSGSVPTKAQFIAQAEDICRKLSSEEKPLKARQEALKGLSAASSDKAFVSLAHQVVALSRAAGGKLQALPRPPGDAGMIEKLLIVYNEDATDVSNIAYAVANQESSAGEAAAEALKRSITVNSGLAEGFGMKDCTGSE
jgi:hypothetical protein